MTLCYVPADQDFKKLLGLKSAMRHFPEGIVLRWERTTHTCARKSGLILLGLEQSGTRRAITRRGRPRVADGYRATAAQIRASKLAATPRGELRSEPIACSRQSHRSRRPRARGEDRRGTTPNRTAFMIGRPRSTRGSSRGTGKAI